MSDRPMTVEKALALVEEVFSRCGAYGNNWVMPAEHRQALFVLRAALEYRKEKPYYNENLGGHCHGGCPFLLFGRQAGMEQEDETMSDRPMTVEKALALVEEVFSRCGAYGNNWVMPAEHTQALFVLRAALKYRKEKP